LISLSLKREHYWTVAALLLLSTGKTMGDLTENLSRHEIACADGCGFDTSDYELVVAIQKACDHFNAVHQADIIVIITGGNRCKAHNATIKGSSPDSYHIKGKAVDHRFRDRYTGEHIDPQEVYDYYDGMYPDKYGIIIYSNRIHLDVRVSRFRLDRR